ncbi:PREDICTED: uncharacterized protein LOC102020372 [Chinchilla lanigera]|uniref:uncharacterized protein LOC102020372 n=1 Tax=Chinchilla lanigera TaxID=34839 RepID=UPI00038EE024|nr:PREDICTED: uncharacterized protein LOC102020372 [Chinchilla lanigera]
MRDGSSDGEILLNHPCVPLTFDLPASASPGTGIAGDRRCTQLGTGQHFVVPTRKTYLPPWGTKERLRPERCPGLTSDSPGSVARAHLQAKFAPAHESQGQSAAGDPPKSHCICQCAFFTNRELFPNPECRGSEEPTALAINSHHTLKEKGSASRTLGPCGCTVRAQLGRGSRGSSPGRACVHTGPDAAARLTDPSFGSVNRDVRRRPMQALRVGRSPLRRRCLPEHGAGGSEGEAAGTAPGHTETAPFRYTRTTQPITPQGV